MASLDAAIFTALTSYAPLAAIVSTRVFPSIAQQAAAYPYIVYFGVYASPQNSLSGWSGVDNIRLQVSCWATTKAQANNIADQVRSAMAQANAAYRGVCIGVLDVPVQNGLDVYHVITEFSLWTA